MAIEYNHTIVWSRDAKTSARFLADILGLPEPKTVFHFQAVTTANGVNIDFADKQGDITSQHHAFLVGDTEFDAIFGRIKQRELSYWADPARRMPGEINRNDGGRGVYFLDPDGHVLEIITKPYGSGDREP